MTDTRTQRETEDRQSGDPWATVALTPATDAPGKSTVDLVEVSATTRSDSWSATEIQKLCDLFKADWSVQDIADAIGRPLHGTRSKIDAIGLRRNSQRPWTEEEDQELLERYGRETAAVIAADIGRNPSSVYARAAQLGATDFAPERWSEWEIGVLVGMLSAGWAYNAIAAALGRPLSGVIDQAHKRGLRSENAYARWSAEEDHTMLRMVLEEDLAASEISGRLSTELGVQRSRKAVILRLKTLGIDRQDKQPWTEDEDSTLRAMYDRGRTATEIAYVLCRTKGGVRWRARYLKLQHPNARGDAWREDERDYLCREYGRKDAQTLADALGRPKRSVQAEASRLGLRVRKRWTPEEDRRLLNHQGRLKDLAAELNVNYQSMMRRRKTLLDARKREQASN